MYQKINADECQQYKNYGMTDFLRSLDIGESFKIPLSVRASASSCAIQIGMKLRTRKIDEKNCIATRIK